MPRLTARGDMKLRGLRDIVNFVNFTSWRGALAQLGEQLLCKHQVIGSIPIGSTRAAAETD